MTETEGIRQRRITEGHHQPTAKNQSTNWHQINWKKAERIVHNLRSRIFRAAKRQDWKKIRDLTRLMLRSYSNLLVSTKRVCQVNHGKNTPGMDGEIADTPKKRGKLVDKLRNYQPWKASPVKRVHIPKNNGKMRPLGIATIKGPRD